LEGARRRKKEIRKKTHKREGWEDGTPPPHRDFKERSVVLAVAHLVTQERKKTYNPREGWEDGTPPPHRDFKERGVVR